MRPTKDEERSPFLVEDIIHTDVCSYLKLNKNTGVLITIFCQSWPILTLTEKFDLRTWSLPLGVGIHGLSAHVESDEDDCGYVISKQGTKALVLAARVKT